ncbi:MAG: hypothetical protein J7507_16850 [Pseudoxanthomonas sp.]|nr:hypothetical protein [Pseudoxanthomonas sp.]
MPETLLAVIEFVSSHPWLVVVIPAVFVGLQLAVVRPLNARARRRYEDRAAQRAARDLHAGMHRRARGSESRE